MKFINATHILGRGNILVVEDMPIHIGDTLTFKVTSVEKLSSTKNIGLVLTECNN